MIGHLVEALELDIPTKPKFLLVCLADSADQYGICFPSMATLSRYTSMPERTLQRALDFLISSKIIEVYWSFTDKIRHKKIRHFRLCLSSAQKAIQPDYSNCPVQLRSEVITRFSETCAYCDRKGGDSDPDGFSWQIDRIIPGSKGGQYVAGNVALACRKCNLSKGAKLAPQEIKSLGAILNMEGCQTGEFVVPPMAPKALVEAPVNINARSICKTHPDSGITQWGTCWDCYVNKYSHGATA